MNVNYYRTSIGKIGIGDDGESVTRVFAAKFERVNEIRCENESKESEIAKKAFEQIEEYLNSKRMVLDFKIHIKGTPFQERVWAALQAIPYGETKSYKQVAQMLNEPKKARAVGGACNKNPLLLIVPCHRVIGSNGKLTGFAIGLDIKERLLKLEKRRD